MWCEKLTPKKFLCRFSLYRGALFIGFFTLAISIICVICLAAEIGSYKKCKNCTDVVMHSAYSFCINAIIYCVIMVFVNCCFIWGLLCGSRKSSVVLCWVVITALWWAQSFMLIFILLCMYVAVTGLAWIVALICAIIAFMVFAYCILTVYGYWLEIRKSSQSSVG